ncbi:MAG: GatB/YqeY domain-containing protein [SAR202 cluster bacterium]|nr:GatB/YqeY domain-containing protein [SAR202 cluster bacterium]
MSLKQRLEGDLKDAMRQGDTLRRSVIRFIRSAIHNQEIADQKELDDDGIIGVLSSQAQQRRDSIEAFTQGNRPELADKEKSELAIVLEYMPEQLSAEEITDLVKSAMDEVGAAGPADMGKVMGRVMPQVKGKAEGRVVSTITSDLLRSLEA